MLKVKVTTYKVKKEQLPSGGYRYVRGAIERSYTGRFVAARYDDGDLMCVIISDDDHLIKSECLDSPFVEIEVLDD